MLILQILRSFIISAIFTLLSMLISIIFATSLKQVYHTIVNLQKKHEIRVVFFINLFLSTAVIYKLWGVPFFYLDILLLFMMSLMAILDTMTSRIPVYFFVVSFLLGLIIGIMKDQIIENIIGGIGNLGIGLLIYLTGKHYKKKVLKQEDPNPVFGMGDVYACSGVGFLLGFPSGSLAILLALILAVLEALAQSIVSRENILKMRINLGLSFYSATAIILFVQAL